MSWRATGIPRTVEMNRPMGAKHATPRNFPDLIRQHRLPQRLGLAPGAAATASLRNQVKQIPRPLDQDSTLVAVIEMGQASWLVSRWDKPAGWSLQLSLASIAIR
jgi:hypothetical protein